MVSTLRRIPDLEFLFGHSHSTLCSLELAALNRSSEHLRRAEAEMNEAVAQREVAGVARWLIENRETLLEAAHNSLPVIAVTKKQIGRASCRERVWNSEVGGSVNNT